MGRSSERHVPSLIADDLVFGGSVDHEGVFMITDIWTKEQILEFLSTPFLGLVGLFAIIGGVIFWWFILYENVIYNLLQKWKYNYRDWRDKNKLCPKCYNRTRYYYTGWLFARRHYHDGKYCGFCGEPLKKEEEINIFLKKDAG